MNIAIRVDASVQIGIGHYMRCMTLADVLRQKGSQIYFISCQMPEKYRDAIIEKGYEFVLLNYRSSKSKNTDGNYHTHPHTIDQLADAQDSIEKLPDYNWDWLIVDHYGLDTIWHTKLRKITKNILVIDDLADKMFDCDFLLDQTFGRTVKAYKDLVPKQCQMLLGTRYALLRPEFLKLRFHALQQRVQLKGIDNILISMGGTDPDNATKIMLEALTKINWKKLPNIEVILGSNAPYLNEIIQQANNHLLNVTVSIDVEDMAEHVMKADIAIGAGGSSSWERCCLGLPSLVTVTADNQTLVALNLEKMGAIKLVGNVNSLKLEDVVAKIKQFISQRDNLSKMSNNAFNIIDGLGAKRVVMEMTPLFSKDSKPIRLRSLNIEDTDLIYEWQTDPNTRLYSHNTSLPNYDEHVNWIKNRVEDNLSITDVILHSGEPAGVIRLDPIEDKSIKHAVYLISIYISPGKYRLGLAGNVLSMVNKLMEHAELRAEVNEGNLASHSLFSGSGYIQQDDHGLYIRKSVA